MLNGYYRDEVVYINRDLGHSGSVAGGCEALSDRLVKVALEEIAHYATNGATDNSRDFQDYVLEVAVKLARKRWQQRDRICNQDQQNETQAA